MQASGKKQGVPRWALPGYVLSAALITLIGYRAGSVWIGNLLAILLSFPMAALAKPESRRVARFAHLVLSLTLLSATALILFLNAPERVNAIEANGFLSFLMGGVAARVLVSIAVALASSLFLLILPLITLAYISSDWLLSMRSDSDITRSQAVRLFLSVIFNTNYYSCLVEEGKITNVKPSGKLSALGGPGKVVVKPYNAVIIEKGGEISRIEGPGKILTRDGEVVKGAINLRKQSRSFRSEGVLTKDNIPLSFECGIGFRIESAKDTAKRGQTLVPEHQGGRFRDAKSGEYELISGDYKVYKHVLYRAFYDTTASGWESASEGAAKGQLQAVVGGYRFQELYRIRKGKLRHKPSAIAEIREEVKRRVSDVSHNWGATITGFSITSVEVPEGIKEEWLEIWAARYAQERLKIVTGGAAEALGTKAQAEAEALGHLERVRSQVRQAFIDQIQQGLGQGMILTDAVAARFIAAIERISQNLFIDGLNTIRYIEMLEKIAESEGTKTLVIGEEKGLLGPGQRQRTIEE